MDLELKGRTAIVTVSTAGSGLAIAETLAQEGATEVVNGRTEERVGRHSRGFRSKRAGRNCAEWLRIWEPQKVWRR